MPSYRIGVVGINGIKKLLPKRFETREDAFKAGEKIRKHPRARGFKVFPNTSKGLDEAKSMGYK